jgi:hypothetical protein
MKDEVVAVVKPECGEPGEPLDGATVGTLPWPLPPKWADVLDEKLFYFGNPQIGVILQTPNSLLILHLHLPFHSTCPNLACGRHPLKLQLNPVCNRILHPAL